MPDALRAVYYAKADHIGLIRRLLIDIVDGVVLVLGWIVVYLVLAIAGAAQDLGNFVFFTAFIAISFCYLVLLKRYARTFGYILFGAQLVNVHGEEPSMGALALRAVFVFIGPGNTLLDLVWLSGDRHHQAIRDKIARTYVIRRGSRPAGQGHIRYVRLSLLGYQLILPEVEPDEVEAVGRGA